MADINKAQFGWIDNSNERTRTQIYVARYASTGLDYTAINAGIETLRSDLDTLTLLNETKVSVGTVVHSATPTPPASVLAQREHGLRFTCVDNVNGKSYRFDVPGVDETTYRTPGTDVCDLTQTDIAQFVSDYNGFGYSPDGNLGTIVSARFYGKNN